MKKFSEFIVEAAAWNELFKMTTKEVAKAYSKNKHGYDFTEDNNDKEILDTIDMIASSLYRKFNSKIDSGSLGIIKNKGSNTPGGISYRAEKDVSKDMLKWVATSYNPNND